ncbi:hypothetical protein HYC85_030241 [Camellia sinensis]|uniref:Uncharacterized protein n=1 Tax=Camellia sinensis TaxID=4442 RepID=A0A7J7G053_CAMSI|nr:hypothetical protein HYC85_030241 [Camellia sinensis]
MGLRFLKGSPSDFSTMDSTVVNASLGQGNYHRINCNPMGHLVATQQSLFR